MSTKTSLENEPLLTVKQVANLFNIKVARIRWEIFHKRLPVYKIGGSVFLRASEIELWIQDAKRGIK